MLLPRLCPPASLHLRGILALLLFAAHVQAEPGAAPATADAPEHVELAPAQIDSLAVVTTPATRATTIDLDGLLGRVELPPAGTRVIASPYAGRIAQVLVDEGERVDPDQLLAVVDSRDFADQRARLLELDSQIALARTQATRDELLAREGIVAQARANTSVARIRELAAQRDALAAALGAIAKPADGALMRFELRAPAAGIVVRRHVLTGERVDALAPIFVLAANTAWRVEVHVPVAVATRLGSEATLRLGTFEVPITGRGLTLDEHTQTVVVRGDLPADSGYVPGQQIIASLRLPAPVTALAVPRDALTHRGERAFVFARTETGFRALPVTVLGEGGGIAVIDGASLAPGDLVASGGVSALKSLLER